MIENLTTQGKNIIILTTLIGGFVSNALGGFDTFLRLLLVLIVSDYVTGVAVAITSKTLNSSVGFMGIVKKIALLVIVFISVSVTTYSFSSKYMTNTLSQFRRPCEKSQLDDLKGLFQPK